ncbi:MAG: two-component system histidine kinase PnpS [Nitrospiria bacterium]
MTQNNTLLPMSRENGQLQTILENMIEGILVLNGAGKIILMNPSFEKMFSIPKERREDPLYSDLLTHQELQDVIKKALRFKKTLSQEITFLIPDERVFQVHASIISKSDHAELTVIFVFHDITNLRRLERIRKDFVGNVSHELRTPLTSIKGFCEALREGAVTDPVKSIRFLEIIETNAIRLENILTDLLQISQLESGNLKLRYEKIEVKSLLDAILILLKPAADYKRQSLIVDRDEKGKVLYADSHRIEQVFINLIDNAIKYTPEGGQITIKTSMNPGEDFEIIVSDTGIGIPQKDQTRIFERFYRVDKGRSREQGGTGLGLSIVKHIVELHGGNIQIESTPNQGSRFMIKIPQNINL